MPAGCPLPSHLSCALWGGICLLAVKSFVLGCDRRARSALWALDVALGMGLASGALFPSHWMCMCGVDTLALNELRPALARPPQIPSELKVCPVIVTFLACGRGRGRGRSQWTEVSRGEEQKAPPKSFLHLSDPTVHLGVVASVSEWGPASGTCEEWPSCSCPCWAFPASQGCLLHAGHRGPAPGCVAGVPRSTQSGHVLATRGRPFAEAAERRAEAPGLCAEGHKKAQLPEGARPAPVWRRGQQ